MQTDTEKRVAAKVATMLTIPERREVLEQIRGPKTSAELVSFAKKYKNDWIILQEIASRPALKDHGCAEVAFIAKHLPFDRACEVLKALMANESFVKRDKFSHAYFTLQEAGRIVKAAATFAHGKLDDNLIKSLKDIETAIASLTGGYKGDE